MNSYEDCDKEDRDELLPTRDTTHGNAPFCRNHGFEQPNNLLSDKDVAISNIAGYSDWHWFSVMGTVLPFAIITYAI
jgi:hypothetical protein